MQKQESTIKEHFLKNLHNYHKICLKIKITQFWVFFLLVSNFIMISKLDKLIRVIDKIRASILMV